METGLRVERGSGIPVGTQLSWKLQSRIQDGTFAPGERLPSVRDLAREAGVNVNTVRAVYGRLEDEGLLVSEQGRGTFVSSIVPARDHADRARLRDQIAQLELELTRLPPLPAPMEVAGRSPSEGGHVLSTEELASVRDELLDRLQTLNAQRQQILQELATLKRSDPAPGRARGSTTSPIGARVRWLAGR